MSIPAADREILRPLAERVAQIASLPVHRQTVREWRRLNARKPGRPLVWINELPWHEMDVDGELAVRCTDPLARQAESHLRTVIYLWTHMPGDMVVEPVYRVGLAISDSGFGIHEDVRIERTDPRSGVVSREFHQQIRDEKDLDKIRTPVVTHDAEATERSVQALAAAFGDILPVQKCGVTHSWFAPWDELIRWWDVEEAMVDLYERPALVHAAMDRLVTAYLARLDQWRTLNLLSLPEGNYRVGSGGLGYSDELPGPVFDPSRVGTHNQWGCATAQIFSDVSPEMHEEFALRYERRWLKEFRITYYGCCEPLHNKLDILASVPNLRKISMSPWADVDKYMARAADRYVLSHKPNPAVLATDDWNLPLARRNLEEVLERTRGAAIEVILKDVSTVRYQPRRLWDWARMATDVAARYA